MELWLKWLIGIVAWILLNIYIVRQLSLLHKQHRDNIGKLDFVEWYELNKVEVLNKISKRNITRIYKLEDEIDQEYQAYLQS